ncbi:MAG: hypothetical protein KC516_04820, partial [Nanoarchaeota archaeon]|nr:hypothetical protein [Nanoarchaeota archaeon]
ETRSKIIEEFNFNDMSLSSVYNELGNFIRDTTGYKKGKISKKKVNYRLKKLESSKKVLGDYPKA